MDLSVVVITLNEEKRLGTCLGSLPGGCEVIVVDSFSQDQTCSIAKAHGAKVFQQVFVDYAQQKNFGLAQATRSWVLFIDADEVLDTELAANLVNVCASAQAPYEGYRLRRRLVFWQKELRFGKSTDFPLRLIKKSEGEFKNAIHETLALKGGKQPGMLTGVLLHHSYADLNEYFQRFNLYTTKVAQNHFNHGKVGCFGLSHWLRPWIEFINRYVLRFGFLDGYPGYCYALFSSLYAFVKYAKLREMQEVNEIRGPRT